MEMTHPQITQILLPQFVYRRRRNAHRVGLDGRFLGINAANSHPAWALPQALATLR